MRRDYLDLLLARETREIPLAEPRILPATAVPVSAAPWSEINEERPTTSATVTTTLRDQPVIARAWAEAETLSLQERAVPAQRLHEREDEAVPVSRKSEGSIEIPGASQVVVREVVERALPPTQSSRPGPSDVTPPSGAVVTERQPLPPPAERWFPGRRQEKHDSPQALSTRPLQPISKPPLPPTARQQVTIRIDRVEVRAAPPKPASTTPKPRPAPRLGLEEYLQRRNGRKD